MKNIIKSFLILLLTTGFSFGQIQILPLKEPGIPFSSPLKPITFKIGLLEVKPIPIPAGTLTPHKGYLLKRSDIGLLKTVVDNVSSDFTRQCDTRISTYRDELDNCQEDCNERVLDINLQIDKLETSLEQEKELHDSTRLKYTLYGFGGAVVSSLVTALVLRISN